MGYPRGEVIQVLLLLGDICISSKPVGQGHTFASNAMRRHKAYVQERLSCRSMVAASVRSWVDMHKMDRMSAAAQRNIENVKKKRPLHLTGRQFYLQQLKALAGQWARDGRAAPNNISVI